MLFQQPHFISDADPGLPTSNDDLRQSISEKLKKYLPDGATHVAMKLTQAHISFPNLSPPLEAGVTRVSIRTPIKIEVQGGEGDGQRFDVHGLQLELSDAEGLETIEFVTFEGLDLSVLRATQNLAEIGMSEPPSAGKRTFFSSDASQLAQVADLLQGLAVDLGQASIAEAAPYLPRLTDEDLQRFIAGKALAEVTSAYHYAGYDFAYDPRGQQIVAASAHESFRFFPLEENVDRRLLRTRDLNPAEVSALLMWIERAL